jgi:uncharacterized membrane protein
VDPGIKLDYGLPVRKEDYEEKFDVVILGDIGRAEFTPLQLQYLKDFVTTSGGGLLTLGGYHAYGEGAWAGSTLAEMLPVAIGPKDGQVRGSFSPKLTMAGRADEVFAGCGELFAEGSGRAVLDGANRVAGVRPGATVLLVHPSETVPGMAGTPEPLPIVAYQQCGSGRVISLTADTTWKWKFQVESKGLDSPYYRFWRQAVRWLATPRKKISFQSKELVSAWPNKIEFKHGETVLLEAQVRGKDKEPQNNATVQAEIQYPGPVQKTNPRGEKYEEVITVGTKTVPGTNVQFQHLPLSLGEYQVPFHPAIGGIYHVLVSAADDGGPLGDAEFDFVVGEITTEFDRVDVDELALRSLAGETGGQFYTLATAAGIPGELEKRRRDVTYHEELNLWNAPGFFLLFLTCVSMEWFLRKRFALS